MSKTFETFLKFFPTVELPIILSEEYQNEINKTNDVMPQVLLEQYIIPFHEEVDELTEFIPCCKLPKGKDFYALVYWKAEFLQYSHYMITYTQKGELIDHCLLSSTTIVDNTLLRSVATIDLDWHVHVMAGEMSTEVGAIYDATKSKQLLFEIEENGSITPI